MCQSVLSLFVFPLFVIFVVNFFILHYMNHLRLLLLTTFLAFPANPDWITEAGGTVTRDRAGNILAVDLRASWVTDADLPQLAALPHLAQLDLSHTRITDHGLQQLKNAPAITDLNLYYAEQITDEGMAAVKGW